MPTWCYLRENSPAYCDEETDICFCKGALTEDKSQFLMSYKSFYKHVTEEAHEQRGWYCSCELNF